MYKDVSVKIVNKESEGLGFLVPWLRPRA